MRYRLKWDENLQGFRSRPAPIPLRWFPDVGGRWRVWREARTNMRHVPEQTMAVRGIESWLSDVLVPDGSVDSYVHVPRQDLVTFEVQYRQQRRELEFISLLAWPNIDPRDELESDILDAMREPSESDPALFVLGGYAEASWLNQSGPFD